MDVPNRRFNNAIGRLSLYRRLLADLLSDGTAFVCSHDLAVAAGVTASQVRRDLMLVRASGSSKGYETAKLMDLIAAVMDPEEKQEVALVGVGNLGRAVLAYFAGRRPKLAITAAFDIDPSVTGRLIHGCPCHPAEELGDLISRRGIRTAIIAVPAGAAQRVADALVGAGVWGIMSFAPARLRVPVSVYVENMDLTSSLEKTAFFARQREAT